MSINIDIANDLDRWLPALADPTRRRIVEMLGQAPRTATQIHQAFPIAAPAVSRHLRVLREAGLIVEQGVPDDRRVRLYALAREPIAALSRWCEQLSQAWQDQLEAFKDYVELRRQPPPGGSR
jgi:DNA-binding transcriptional ArsR family regulator